MDPNRPAPPGDESREPRQAGGVPTRVVEIVAGDFLVTVNPVDGSEIESCPPGRRPITPRQARPPAAGETSGVLSAPLLEREEQRERLTRMLARGRSTRLVGAPGSGRSALLAAVARDCAGLAPDGVIQLSGHRRTPADLLHELYAFVHHASGYRPGTTDLRAALREIGAVVVIDDVEFGELGLAELLDATPECAFLISAGPGAPKLGPAAGLEEVVLAGLSRAASLALLELLVRRPLSAAETGWAVELWQESEGLPQVFVQAAALLREAAVAGGAGLPPEGGRPAVALAERLSEDARDLLRFAVALSGEVPGRDQAGALTGHPAAAESYDRLVACGLFSPVGGRHRLAAGVLAELAGAGYEVGAPQRTLAALQHYTRLFAEVSASSVQAAAESEVLVAMLRNGQRAGHTHAVAALARAVAPRLAALPRWGVWERVLRGGGEAARAAGEVGQQAYFHHELGVLAICQGQLDRARAELEASTALRGVLADASGAVAGRRALALVEDLGVLPVPGALAHTPAQGVRPVPSAVALPGAGPKTSPLPAVTGGETAGPEPGEPGRDTSQGWKSLAVAGTRRNTVAAGAGVLLTALLGTVVALGLTSEEVPDEDPGPDPAATEADAKPEEESSEPTRDPSPPEIDDAASSAPPTEPETEEPPSPQESESSAPEPDPTTPSQTQSPDESPDEGTPTRTPSEEPTGEPTEEPGPTEEPDPDPDPDPEEPDPDPDPDPTSPPPESPSSSMGTASPSESDG